MTQHPSLEARRHSRKAIDVLLGILDDPTAAPRERLGAAKEMIRIAWGSIPVGSKEPYEQGQASELDKFQEIINELSGNSGEHQDSVGANGSAGSAGNSAVGNGEAHGQLGSACLPQKSEGGSGAPQRLPGAAAGDGCTTGDNII